MTYNVANLSNKYPNKIIETSYPNDVEAEQEAKE
jgi:hypothetical protein